MNFQDLAKIEDADFYLELAFRNSKKIGNIIFLKSSGDTVHRIRKAEIEKAMIFTKSITEKFEKIIKSYPSMDNMPEFYQELVRCTLDYDKLKKCLGSLNWVNQRSADFLKIYQKRLQRAKNKPEVVQIMKEFYGRISSLVKQVKSNLAYLEYSRKIMRDYPTLKTDLFTVAITGFPNIGKSTLLSKITPARPKIENYAFTTTGLNQGYAKYGLRKVQFVDTPGVLGRDKRNIIEEQAYLILKYLANVIVYIIDLTDSYPLEKQTRLLEGLREYDKPIIVYLSKTDLLDSKVVEKAKRKYKAVDTLDKLNTKIEKSIKEHYFN